MKQKKSFGKDAVVVLGNTGAGKSTTINYLFGCRMQKFKPQEIGFYGLKKVVVVQPTSMGGTIDEIMPIGHRATQSQTFVPQIETDNENSITYIDCPGFLDNRGPEINIANSLNIKKAIKNCRTVRVVVLIGYHSLVADKAKGLRDLIDICHSLFSTEETFLRNGKSIHIGITDAPEDFEINDLLQVSSEENSQLGNLTSIAERFFLFDPLDDKESASFWKREEFIERLKVMKPINEEDCSVLFRTVLRPEEQNAIQKICESMDSKIQKHFESKEFDLVFSKIESLEKLKEVDHRIVYDLLNKSNTRFIELINELKNDFYMRCLTGDFASAQKILDDFLGYEGFITGEIRNAFSVQEMEETMQDFTKLYEQNNELKKVETLGGQQGSEYYKSVIKREYIGKKTVPYTVNEEYYETVYRGVQESYQEQEAYTDRESRTRPVTKWKTQTYYEDEDDWKKVTKYRTETYQAEEVAGGRSGAIHLLTLGLGTFGKALFTGDPWYYDTETRTRQVPYEEWEKTTVRKEKTRQVPYTQNENYYENVTKYKPVTKYRTKQVPEQVKKTRPVQKVREEDNYVDRTVRELDQEKYNSDIKKFKSEVTRLRTKISDDIRKYPMILQAFSLMDLSSN